MWAKTKRDGFDAILVGVNTIITDDPLLNAPKKRLKKIVVDSALRVPASARIFRLTKPEDIVIATTNKASLAKREQWLARGVEVVVVLEKAGRVDLKRLFKDLAKRKIASILIEGGSTILGAALKAGLVDRLHVYVAPKVMGRVHKKGAVTGLDVRQAAKDLQFEIRDLRRVGPDVFIELCSPGS